MVKIDSYNFFLNNITTVNVFHYYIDFYHGYTLEYIKIKK
mgnify:CR=1 FL=1